MTDAMPISGATLEALRSAIGAGAIRIGDAVTAIEPGRHPDNLLAGIIVEPSTTAEVAAVVRLCRDNGIGIVPHGGRTGLVGGGISSSGEIVLSTARLNRIVRLDPIERVAVVETGVTLHALQEAGLAHRLEPGIDLPSRGSATIGGMVSTNAGGMMAFRNGVMRHRILGIEAVLADGSVYSDLTRVVKNAAGYDLKHLFIGAEGTLGFVTRVAIKLDPIPLATATAMFGLPTVAAVLDVIRRALDSKAGTLRAAEALWQDFFRLSAADHGFHDAGLDPDQPLYLLLSLGGSDQAELQAALETLFEELLPDYPDATGIVATSARQERDLWLLREDTDGMYRAFPGSSSYDISIPLSGVETYVDQLFQGLAAIEPGLRPFVFGHLADGNLHIVLNRPGPLPAALVGPVETVLYGPLAGAGGSFSAEHGVGSRRIHALAAAADPTKLALMRGIKQLLDPTAIFNRRKVLPEA